MSLPYFVVDAADSDGMTAAQRALDRIAKLSHQADELAQLVDEAIVDALTADPPASISEVARALRRSKSAAYSRWLRIQRGRIDNEDLPPEGG